jgi:hypothetical protein
MSKKKKHNEVYGGPVSTDADIAAMISGMVASGEIKTKGNNGGATQTVATPEEVKVFVPKQRKNKHNDVVDSIAMALGYAASSMSQTGRTSEVIPPAETAPIPPEIIAKAKVAAPKVEVSDDKNPVQVLGRLRVGATTNNYGQGIIIKDNFSNAIVTQIYPASAETSAIDGISEGDLTAMIRNFYVALKFEMYPDCICSNLDDLTDAVKYINENYLIVVTQNERYFCYIIDNDYIDTKFAPKLISTIKNRNGSVVGTIVSLFNTFNEVPTLREFMSTAECNADVIDYFKENGAELYPSPDKTRVEDVTFDLDAVWESCYAEVFNIITKLHENYTTTDEEEEDNCGIPEEVYDDFMKDINENDNLDESDEDADEEDEEEEIGASNDNDSFRDLNGKTEDVSADREPVRDTSRTDEVQMDFEPFTKEVQDSNNDNDSESIDIGGRVTTSIGDVLKDAGIIGADNRTEQPSGSTPIKEVKEEVKETPQQEELGRGSSNQKAEEKKEEVDDMVINIRAVGKK